MNDLASNVWGLVKLAEQDVTKRGTYKIKRSPEGKILSVVHVPDPKMKSVGYKGMVLQQGRYWPASSLPKAEQEFFRRMNATPLERKAIERAASSSLISKALGHVKSTLLSKVL